MLYGEKRVAYYRIPAYEILYSSNFDPDATGRYCGKIQTLNLKVSIYMFTLVHQCISIIYREI